MKRIISLLSKKPLKAPTVEHSFQHALDFIKGKLQSP